MSVSFKIKNPGKVMTALVKRSKKFRMLVARNYVLGANEFIRDIQDKYYSGRNGDIGLNQQTTNLWKNWIADVDMEGKEIVATIYSEMKYSIPWEYGTKGKEKRTFVVEEMMGGSGEFIFEEASRKALKEAF